MIVRRLIVWLARWLAYRYLPPGLHVPEGTHVHVRVSGGPLYVERARVEGDLIVEFTRKEGLTQMTIHACEVGPMGINLQDDDDNRTPRPSRLN